ncbi:MAG: hypothetical protein RL374_108 [Actinomycetota bacterium]
MSGQLFALNNAASDTQKSFLSFQKLSPFTIVYVPAGRVPHPGPTGAAGAFVAPGVAGLAGVVTLGATTACGGMRNVWPGYGNCAGLTIALYASNVVSEIPNLLATASGESPATTVYTVSAPTALDGNVVEGPGSVLATGGIVAKLVGVTFTTVVATPKVSPPHDAKPKPETMTKANASDVDFDLGMRGFLNTDNNSRA